MTPHFSCHSVYTRKTRKPRPHQRGFLLLLRRSLGDMPGKSHALATGRSETTFQPDRSCALTSRRETPARYACNAPDTENPISRPLIGLETFMPRITADQAGGQNVCALLDTIAWSEIGEPLLISSDDGYDVLVGSTATKPLLFTSYATHPDVYNPRFSSTAAGRYQELNRNWLAYRPLLNLPDFGPVSQDRMALQQIQEAGAIPVILNGQFDQAIALIAHLWASLPGADYGQPTQQMSELRAAFHAAGGQIASLAHVVGSVA